MHAHLIQLTMRLGLTKKEAMVYLALLELGSSTASAIAKKADVDRVNTYNMLASLKEKGLVSEIEKSGVKYFSTESPEKLLWLGEQEKQKIDSAIVDAKSLLPEFLSFYNTGSTAKPRVRFYEGKPGYLHVYNGILEDAPKDLLLFLNYVEFKKLLDQKFEEEWIKKRVELGISLQWLDFKSEEMKIERARHEVLREIRFLPNEYIFSGGIFLYQHKLIFFSTRREFMAVVIENEEFAHLGKMIFEILWKLVAK